VNAYAESNLKGSGYNYFYIANETSGSYNSYTLRNNIFSDSATGECLLVRPRVNGELTPLLELHPNGNSKNSETFTGVELRKLSCADEHSFSLLEESSFTRAEVNKALPYLEAKAKGNRSME